MAVVRIDGLYRASENGWIFWLVEAVFAGLHYSALLKMGGESGFFFEMPFGQLSVFPAFVSASFFTLSVWAFIQTAAKTAEIDYSK